MPPFVRFQSAVPNRHGRWPGVFALANGLAAQGRLTAADERWWRAANERATASYPDPTTVVPGCYDPVTHPGARAWFRRDAAEQLAMVRGYLDLLDRYAVPWMELRTAAPGRMVYEDRVQVVAVPPTFASDWPF